MENVADGVPEKCQNHCTHDGAQGRINPRRGLHSSQIQRREQHGKNDRPQQAGVRNLISRSAQQVGHRLGAPDSADQWIQHVIHRHAPAGDVAKRGVQGPSHVGVSRTRAGIDPRHASVAHGGEDHGDHGDQNRSDHMTLAGIAEYAISRHGGGRLDDDDAVKDQVPKGERSAKPHVGGGSGAGWSGFHSRVLNYAACSPVND